MRARDDDDDPRLQLVPASLRSRIWLFLISVALPLLLVLLLPLFPGDAHSGALARFPGSEWLPRHLLLPLWVGLVTIPIWLAVNWLMSRRRVVVGDGVLEVVTTLYRDRVPLQDLQLDDARMIDLDEYSDRRPFLKTGGMAMPGFRSGWFRTRGFRRLFVATAGSKRVLWLPTSRKHTLLLELRDPRALLDRLRELNGHPTPL